MAAILLIVVLLFTPTLTMLLALRFGPDSRPSCRSTVRILARRDLGWDTVGAPVGWVMTGPGAPAELPHEVAHRTAS